MPDRKLLLLIGLLFFLNCCNNKKSISIEEIGAIEFRKSYASQMGIQTEEERQKFYAFMDSIKPNTVPTNSTESFILRNLTIEGFALDSLLNLKINNDAAIIEKTKLLHTSEALVFKSCSGQNFRVLYDYNFENSQILVLSHNDTIKLNINSPMASGNSGWILVNWIPGCEKQILFFDQYYIMNGFNYRFSLYRIKTL